MKKFESILDAKIGAKNWVNTIALANIPMMLEALKPFIGKRATNQSGAISENVKKHLPQDPNTPDCSWWYSGSDYSISVRFKTCVTYAGTRGDYYAKYAETVVTLAEVHDHAITKLITDHKLRTDYSAKEVLDARDELRAAKSAVARAQCNLEDFGEFDA